MPRFLLKRVKRKMDEQPESPVLLGELHALVATDSSLCWGIEPRSSVQVKNSDGSVAQLSPHPGFFIPSISETTFVVCYEHYDGIAMHCADDERAIAKCVQLAEALHAKVFRI